MHIDRIRALKGVGVLADISAKDPSPKFQKLNLVYGFNGSGKSTLSRLFASLQANSVHPHLPEACNFEFELSDGTNRSTPDQLHGLQEVVCVFNADFIERNLRWNLGTANSIFYISEEQADAAAALRAAEIELPMRTTRAEAADFALKERTQTLATFKRNLARTVSGRIHLANRKYEAPQLQNDYEELAHDLSSILTPETLDEHEDIARSASPPPPALKIEVPTKDIPAILDLAKKDASAKVGDNMIAELVAHPEMVSWVKTGYAYHTQHDLLSCLFCGQGLTVERKAILSAAFTDALSRFIAELETARGKVDATLNRIELALHDANALVLMPQLKQGLKVAIESLSAAIPEFRTLFATVGSAYEARRSAPTLTVELALPSAELVSHWCERLNAGAEAVNNVIHSHNEAVADFGRHQESARTGIRRHFLAQNEEDYAANVSAVSDAQQARTDASAALTELQRDIARLRDKVRTHGPAAEVVTKLVKAYLGHGELTIVTSKEGYELHRRGKLVKGPPSEGEKTALALCYFLSTLGADGRKLKDLVIVVDDPVSSLDTKAMNYACALIRTRLRQAGQLFVLTHNQHCMNEFRKDWKSLAYPKDPNSQATAALLYVDVKISAGADVRSSSLVEMPHLLREYDSEYHFLCSKVLEFEAASQVHSDYGFLMPNVIRRVLELFLAFKVPGTNPIKDKLMALQRHHQSLDATRMAALERLSQVESHSDSMDDFIGHSSMTIEESRDANAALLELMKIADEWHMKAIRKQCEVK